MSANENSYHNDDHSVDPDSPDPPSPGPGRPSPPGQPQSASTNEAILNEAIETAPAAALKNLVRQLLAQVPQSRPVIDAALLRPLNNNNNSGVKRKAHENCENCHASYLVEQNQVGVCRYHPLRQQVDNDDDFWADHDDDCHGDPEHPDLMEDPDFAEGYSMACCGKRPYEPGCAVTMHVSDANPQGPNARVRR